MRMIHYYILDDLLFRFACFVQVAVGRHAVRKSVHNHGHKKQHTCTHTRKHTRARYPHTRMHALTDIHFNTIILYVRISEKKVLF